MDGVVAYILSKKFTKDTVVGMGAIQGAPCEVQSINKVGDTTTVTLKWEDTSGTTHTDSFDILDGEDGISVSNANINSTGNLIITLSNGNTINCGKVLPQYDTMPSPSSDNEGKILQYIGNTTVNYTNGYFYECREVSAGVYEWIQKNVQPSGGAGGGVIEGYYNSTDQLFYEEDTYINPISGEDNTLYISLDTNLLYRYNDTDLIFTRVDEHSDGQTIQVTIMPTADSSQLDKVYQFIGTTGTYVNGGFYKCIYDSGTTTYSWTRILVDDVYTKSEIGTLSDLPDTTQNIVQNIVTIKLDIDQLQASKMDIDGSNCAQTVTFNKVQQGNSAEATGDYSHAEGNFTEAIGIYSHAEGGTYSTQGILSRCTAYGESSHAEGKGTSASGVGSHSEGYGTSANGNGSHAEGVSTIAGQSYQHVSGKYNDNKTDTLFEIGNGSKNGFIVNRSNAFEVYENGDVNYTGILKQNGVDILSTKTNLSDLASAFDNTVSYAVGDYTVYSGGIYRCINAHTGDWDSNDFTLVAITDELKNKVDKIAGKGLSTNDFTDALKDKVIALEPIYLIGSGLNLDRSTGKLTATGMAVPIDSNLSDVSTNPVQNKVITLTIEQLQGSILNKLDKVASTTTDNFAGFDASGNLIDLGINKNIVPSSASSSNKLLTASDNLALGETSTTAYAGDKGKANADHIGNLANLSTTVKTDLVNAINEVKGGIPSVPTAYTSNPEMDGTANAGSSTSWAKGDHVHPTDTSRASATDLSNHISNTSNPHSVTASQVGLGNVVNTGDSATPVSGGTTKFTTGGAYTELNKKADIVSGATEDNFAALDSNGNLKDSGKSSSDFSTVKERKTPASGGQTLSLVNTGDMYTWNNKPTTLGGLTDVTLSSLADGQILEYDGNNSTWKNAENIKDFARFGGSKTFSQLTSSLLTAENVDKFYLCTDGGTISSADASNWILPANSVIPPDSHIAVIEYSTGVYKFDDFGGYIDISGKADKTELDGWTSTATVSNNTVTFSGLDNSYGYDLYCQDKLLGISSITKTTSGSTITLEYTVTGASGGETCKLRIIK